MNNIERIVVDLLKKDLLTIEEVVLILKEVNEISDKTLSFNYDNKDGSNVKINIPADVVRSGIAKMFEKVQISKKEEKVESDKDDIVKNILKLIK